ncbi:MULTISPECIES: hypothetical protein [Nocardia]|uniref:hypothetical protein n=1 Tax=Nocardia TaxID=1817 RepID=UPI0024588FB0|nr:MULTISPECIES: hypothetical protein [Nocardia]
MPDQTRSQRADRLIEDVVDALAMPDNDLAHRYACAMSTLRALWASRRAWQASHDAAQDIAISNSHALDAAQAEIDQLRSGGKTLGSIVDRQCRDALDATGLHHLIDEDGDGDWGAVWENVAYMGSALKAARKRIAELEARARS